MQTLENLAKAFVGESQARNRYTIYSKIAAKEGYPEISDLFLITADNEREHAKWLMRMINEIKEKEGITAPEIIIEAGVETTLGNTIENLQSAIDGENYEHTNMYPDFAKTAREEGLDHIADRLAAIGEAEIHHESKFKYFLESLNNGTIFEKDENTVWYCKKCGFLHKASTPPEKCPSCDHPPQYFIAKCQY